MLLSAVPLHTSTCGASWCTLRVAPAGQRALEDKEDKD